MRTRSQRLSANGRPTLFRTSGPVHALLVCGTATALLIWLTTSFWQQAWQQRSDAFTWERETVVQDALFTAVRSLTAESMLSAGADRRKLFGFDARGLLLDTRAASDAALTVAVSALLADGPSPDDRTHAGRLAAMHDRLRMDRAADDNGALPGNATASAGRGAALRDAVDTIVRDAHRRLEWQQARTHSREPVVERLQRLRALLHTLAEGVVADVRLATARTEKGEALRRWDRRARVRGEDALDSIAVFTVEERRSAGLLDEPLRARIDAMIDRTRATLAQDVSIVPLDTVTFIDRERTAFKALADVERLDDMLATRVRARVDTLLVEASRRLMIDGGLLGVCALLMLATLNLLRTLRYRATHDPLTGLADRACFERRLARALTAGIATPGVALALLDLDGFKQVNDTQGHEAGDRLLCAIARLMTEPGGGTSLAGRLGGDEFVWMFHGPRVADAATDAVTALVERVDQDPAFDGVGISAGLVVAPQDGESAAVLLRRADLAMYDAKRSGGARVRRFHPGLERHRRAGGVPSERSSDTGDVDVVPLPLPRRVFVDERRAASERVENGRGTDGGESTSRAA